MRTVFPHGDVDAFEAARAELAERFGGAAEPLDCLLEDRFARDGLLAWWTEEDLERFLLEVAPRRLVVADWSAVPEFLHSWVDFLAGEGLLSSPSPVGALHRAIDRAVPGFLAAMADPASWGPEKSWSAAMRECGVDPADDARVAEFLAAVDEGAVEVDEEGAAEQADAAPAVWLPPVAVAEEEPHAATAADCPLLHRIRAVLDWVGEGRPVPRESDVDGLAARLSVDRFTAGLLVEWAREAHLLRRVHDRLVPTLLARPLSAEPDLLWSRLWQSFVLLDGFTDDGELDSEDFVEVVQAVLCALYPHADAVPLELVTDLACRVLDGTSRQAVHRAVTRIVDQWESMGALRRYETTAPDVLAEIAELVPADPDPTMVELLSAGVWAARGSLRAFGFLVPEVADLVPRPAELLALLVPECSPDVLAELVPAWIAHRGAPDAAAELAALLRRVDDPSLRLTALWLLERTGDDGVAAVRGLADDPVVGPAARVWLQARGASDDVARPEDEVWVALDGLAASDAPHLLLAELRRHSAAEQLDLLERVPTAGHAQAPEVLDTIARHHPDAEIAAAARRCLERVGC
ncbi:hypothetical protein GCM10025787_43750 [Saccharopolyspora rosea]|uniref:HEAT repeat protein n=1 Tax=Saccharopolyspora rosea TaxID=524884 RepID=A0ABW3FJJ5_9PSEU